MSKAQHFRTWTTLSTPAANDLTELLEQGWDTISVVRGSDDAYIVYLKRIESKEDGKDG